MVALVGARSRVGTVSHRSALPLGTESCLVEFGLDLVRGSRPVSGRLVTPDHDGRVVGMVPPGPRQSLPRILFVDELEARGDDRPQLLKERLKIDRRS